MTSKFFPQSGISFRGIINNLPARNATPARKVAFSVVGGHSVTGGQLTKLFFVIVFLISVLLAGPVQAQDEKVTLYLFYGEDCPHCAAEEKFLNILVKRDLNLEIKKFEVWHSQKNQQILAKVAEELGIKTSAVPITIINGQAIYGYLNDQTIGKQIEEKINQCHQKRCDDTVGPIIEGKDSPNKITNEIVGPNTSSPETTVGSIPEKVKVPFLGELKVKSLSLPILTVVLGALDGFNPCAMWILLFLISFLLGMKDRRKMWILGGSFIFTSAAVYFVFLAAWLNIFLFLGVISWVRLLIGLVALATGFYSARKFFEKKRAGCDVVDEKKRKKISERIREIIQARSFWLALGGMIILAAGVNLVELICSAGLPALFTQVLSLTHLSRWQYYGYLLLYILFYMLDDMIVFIIAMVTLKSVGVSGKYGRYSSLIGGALMIIIGILLLFRPQWLMFG